MGTIDSYGHMGNLIASGSKDSSILIWDVRANESVLRYDGHKQEVGGVKLSSDGNIIASGGNDNAVTIMDFRTNKIYAKFT